MVPTLEAVSFQRYYPCMHLATGQVVAGKVLVDGLDLREGQTVIALAREPEGAVFVTPDEEAELLEAIAESERGGTTSWDELRARLLGSRPQVPSGRAISRRGSGT